MQKNVKAVDVLYSWWYADVLLWYKFYSAHSDGM